MASEISVTNTLAFLFPTGAAQPTLEEMARFVKTLSADKADMESAYKISEERSVYVKFKTEAAMKKALIENTAKHSFRYSNGKVVEVYMSVAGGNVRYVRIFDLPPEVNDQDISDVLQKFGKVKRLEREKFPADLELGDLSTGVRGVHMDIEKDIPPVLRIVGRKGRVYYQHMTQRCYICLSEGHLKAACPIKKSRHNKGTEQSSNDRTYADIAGGSSSSRENVDKAEQAKDDPKHNEEEEVTASDSATAVNAYSIGEPEETEEENLGDEEMDESLDLEDSQKQAWYKIANVIQDYKKAKERDEQSRAAEQQRQQRKKSGTRAKTGSASPPTKKKH